MRFDWMRADRVALLAVDATLVAMAWLFAYFLRFNFEVPEVQWMPVLVGGVLATLGYVVTFLAFGVYAQVWRYTSLMELRRLGVAVAVAALAVAASGLFLRETGVARTVVFFHPVLVMVLLTFVRAVARSATEKSAVPAGAQPLLILGGLEAASQVMRTIKPSQQWFVVGIVSSDFSDHGRMVQGVSVTGGFENIQTRIAETGATGMLVASPSGSPERRDALFAASTSKLPLLTLPHPDDWLVAGRSVLRKVALEDLLGRSSVQLDEVGLTDMLSGQCVLVTGAGGSIGSELCRQLARLGVRELVCIDTSEVAVYLLEQELCATYPQLKTYFYTANVREFSRLLALGKRHSPVVVFHAAAYKHVPLMEQGNEIEAVRTNVIGSLNASRMAGTVGAKRFVLVSTDKAVNPTNIMGASKRMAELFVQAVAKEYEETHYVAVRFGNVLGSSGSVVPLFTEQIAKGGPLTVTHPDIVRYFMTIPEACRLVMQAGLTGATQQIFVLDMGEPVKILELARMMIRLSGKTELDIPIRFTGLRPGEKLFEELLASDETSIPTSHPKLRIAKGSGQAARDVLRAIEWIDRSGPEPSAQDVRSFLLQWIPEYRPSAV